MGLARRVTVLLALPVSLVAQGIVGDWQGTRLQGPRPLRTIVRVRAGSGGRLAASLLSIDEGEGFERSYRADSVILRTSHLTVTWTGVHVRYVGTVSADGNSIRGMWTEDQKPEPLDLVRATRHTAWRDWTAHRCWVVAVEKNVKLEGLDWGGSGPPVVLLAGNGSTPHIFDTFAPKLTPEFHVYGITRRGFGRPSAPTWGYLADSLADDVLAVIDSLRIRRPVLIGHSLAGEELSSIGSRHSERVAGLVYLDAGYAYAFFDSARSNIGLSLSDVQRKLARLADPAIAMSVGERRTVVAELLETGLPILEQDLRVLQKALVAERDQSAVKPAPQRDVVQRALTMGHQEYTAIRAPVLAIFAFPREAPPDLARDSIGRATFDSLVIANVLPQIAAFERGIPSARVVRLAHASHYVFQSHEADVLREIRAFVAQVADHPSRVNQPDPPVRGGEHHTTTPGSGRHARPGVR